MKRLGVLALFVWGCAEPTANVGGFRIDWVETPAAITVFAPDGRELLRTAGRPVEHRASEADWEMSFGSFRVTEEAPEWQGADSLEVVERSAGRVELALGDARVAFTSGADGRLEATFTVPESHNRIRTRFACADTDRFLGFGAQADHVDHRGHLVHSWVSEPGIGKVDDDEPTHADWFLRGTRHASSYPLPVFLSNRGHAFLADTTHRAVFDLCRTSPDAFTVEAWDRTLTVKLFDGPHPAKAVERLTEDIGRQPEANDLALAPWNDAIFGEENVLEVAQLLREHRIPSGALWTEDFRGGAFYGDSYRLHEEWDVDRELYPDVEGLASKLHDLGFRFLAYHNTFLTSTTQVLEEARAAGVVLQHPAGGEYTFTGVKFTETALVDLTHPKAESFVLDRLTKLISYGFDGWMADYAEWQPADAVLADGQSAEAFHNVYARRYHELSSKALAAHDEPNLSTAFGRSGTLRTAPFQPVVWAGDQFTSFDERDGIASVVTMGLNLGLAGISTYAHDIAGYQNALVGPSTKELFFRWTTLGALSPVMRTHHGTSAASNWWFGKDEETIAHFRRWSRFHARLWPYLKVGSKEAHETGLPLMRQLALVAPEHEEAWTIHDAYLFGPSLYVAPVIVEGQTAREAWLPPGSWLRWEAGEALEGARTHTLDVPLTEAGLFARAGAVVPLLPDDFDTLMPAQPPLRDLDDVRARRHLAVFLGADGEAIDLDGTRYELRSRPGTPTDVRIDGAAVPACEGDTVPCVEIDGVGRSVTVRGAKLTEVALRAGDAELAALTVTGALTVEEIVFRY